MSASHPHSGPESYPDKGPDVNFYIPIEQILDDEHSVSIDTSFLYNQSDPYAVDVVFHYEDGSVVWTFGRELLINGMYEPTGDGDVNIYPNLSRDGKSITSIVLRPQSRGETSILAASTRDIAIFLDLTLDLVPQGFESQAYETASMEHIIGKL